MSKCNSCGVYSACNSCMVCNVCSVKKDYHSCNTCQTGVVVSPTDGVDTACDPCATVESSSCVSSDIGNFPNYISFLESFNMPSCSGTADVRVADATRFTKDTIIFNQNVGYLRISAIVDETTVRLLNECLECNVKQPGEAVDTSNVFALGIPTCGPIGTSGVPAGTPFLDLDFISPDVGSCVDIKVTNVNGLSIGDIVSINGFQYRIGAIPTTTQIEICNDGDGDTPGNPTYKDSNNDGVLDHPIVRIGGQNPCTATAINAAPGIVVCDGGGQQTTMVGTVENHVPTWNSVTEQWELKVVDDLATCVSLASCLKLDPMGTPCEDYLVDVSPDTTQLQAAFDAGAPNPLKVTINDKDFCITEILNADTIRVVPSFEVTEVEDYDPGSVLCIAPCCEQCNPTIEVLDRTGGSNECPEEILFGTGIVNLVGVPVGISTYTVPQSLADNNQSGFEEGAGFAWELNYNNDSCCECRKYLEVISNYEFAMNLPADVYANGELRILKTAPVQDSQSFASHPFLPDVQGIVTPNPAIDLIPAFQTINTHKGGIFDRDFVNPGEQMTFKGHVRIVIDNRTAGPVNVDFLVQWRAWVKAWSFSCAPVTTNIP